MHSGGSRRKKTFEPNLIGLDQQDQFRGFVLVSLSRVVFNFLSFHLKFSSEAVCRVSLVRSAATSLDCSWGVRGFIWGSVQPLVLSFIKSIIIFLPPPPKVGQALLSFQAWILGSFASPGYYGNNRRHLSWLYLGQIQNSGIEQRFWKMRRGNIGKGDN